MALLILVQIGQITPILTNKKGQIFPQYVDPVSKKDAESTISTTWKSLRNLLHGMEDQSI